MSKTAWIFPGQGSQAVNMGADLFQLESLQPQLAQANDILGWSVADICQDPDDKVSQTLYTQPCLYVVEALLAEQLMQQGQTPDFVAGHSLGEYVALFAAGVFDFATGLQLVKRRAELMSTATDGAMAAVIGFQREELDAVIADTAGVVLANDNNPMQVVISGTVEGVDAVLAQVKSKRAVKLNVSGAFHSPLMADAAAQFQSILENAEFQSARIPVLSNVDPTPETDGAQLKQRLTQQMTGSVRWREISLQLADAGVERVVEVGPGNVLTGLVKRTCSGMTLENVHAIADLASI